jgi:hypothetical protein
MRRLNEPAKQVREHFAVRAVGAVQVVVSALCADSFEPQARHYNKFEPQARRYNKQSQQRPRTRIAFRREMFQTGPVRTALTFARLTPE